MSKSSSDAAGSESIFHQRRRSVRQISHAHHAVVGRASDALPRGPPRAGPPARSFPRPRERPALRVRLRPLIRRTREFRPSRRVPPERGRRPRCRPRALVRVGSARGRCRPGRSSVGLRHRSLPRRHPAAALVRRWPSRTSWTSRPGFDARVWTCAVSTSRTTADSSSACVTTNVPVFSLMGDRTRTVGFGVSAFARCPMEFVGQVPAAGSSVERLRDWTGRLRWSPALSYDGAGGCWAESIQKSSIACASVSNSSGPSGFVRYAFAARS